MEQKNRLIIVVAIISLITAAMFTSFGRNLFALNTPEVVLPTPDSGLSDAPGGHDTNDSTAYHQVEITPQTVQNVIATLSRPDSYYQEFSVEIFWEGGSSLIPMQVWQDEGWTKVRQIHPSGSIRHDLLGEDTLYYWYEGSSQFQSAPAQKTGADLAQHIPTYESVLELDSASITHAEYVGFGGQPCILVSVSFSDPQRAERYWISIDSGLLVGAENEENGIVTYRMSVSGAITTPCPTNSSFALPNGEILHSIS